MVTVKGNNAGTAPNAQSQRLGLEGILGKYHYHSNLDQLIQQYTKKMKAGDSSRYELISPIYGSAIQLSRDEGGKALENQMNTLFKAYQIAWKNNELTNEMENNMISSIDGLLGKFREDIKTNIKGSDLYNLLPLIFFNKDLRNQLGGLYNNLTSDPALKDTNKKVTLYDNLSDKQKDPKQRLTDYFSSLSNDAYSAYMKKGHSKEDADKLIGGAKKAYESIVNGVDNNTLNMLIAESTKELEDSIQMELGKIKPDLLEKAATNLQPSEYSNITAIYQGMNQRQG
ncbi:MAG: hypothetical protein ACP5MT_01430 [Candidatus Acidifodinimicrobium sp.]